MARARRASPEKGKNWSTRDSTNSSCFINVCTNAKTKFLSPFYISQPPKENRGKELNTKSHSDSRETGLLCRKLACDLQRPLGDQGDNGLYYRPNKPALPTPPSSRTAICSRRTRSPSRGDREHDNQTSHIRDKAPTRRWFRLTDVSSTQKRRRSETSDKPQTAELLCEDRALQDGEHPNVERPAKIRRLDGQNRPEGCILHGSNSKRTPEATPLLTYGVSIPVQLPTIRPVICSVGLYQDHTTGSDNAPRARPPHDHLHRRHADNGRLRAAAQRTSNGTSVPPGKPGVCNKQQEITGRTNTGTRVSGICSELPKNGTQTPRREDQDNQIRGKETPMFRTPNSTSAVPPSRENECSNTSHLDGTAVLQTPSVLSPRDNPGRPGLLGNYRAHPGSEGGAELVGGAFHSLEWTQPHHTQSIDCDRDRRLTQRMGRCLQQGTDRRSVVSPRTRDAHQLPGNASRDNSSAMLRQKQDEPAHTVENGQHVSTVLHQQERGNDIPRADTSRQTTVAVVHGERHISLSRTSSRNLEHCRGRRIQNDEGPHRLETVPSCVQSNQPGARTPECGPIRHQTNSPAAPVRQLETRPTSYSDGCLLQELVYDEGLCQPTMEPDWESVSTMPETESRAGASGSSMEGSTMVPNSPRDGNKDTSPDQTIKRSDPTNGPGQSPRHLTTTSRVEHLRQRYRSCQLSQEATEIIMASWRPKSSKTYDSLYGKWVSWCEQRDSNPISGPIGEVVNFLANLFTEGYQYRSLNAYRSAISSVHEKIDGYEVGQHPLVTRLLKGAFNERPPRPRYTTTWDVKIVTEYLDKLGENEPLSLMNLTLKTVMLLALTRPSRSSDLANLDLRTLKQYPEGIILQTSGLPKQARQNRPIADFLFPSFQDNKRLCPVKSLTEYLKRTAPFRTGNGHEQNPHQVFLSTIKPHSPVASSTIARWLKTTLANAGIDTSIFKAHSTRSAATTAAANKGVTTSDILNAADWSSESVFQKFYYRPSRDTSFGTAVLSKEGMSSTTKSRDM